MNYFDTWDNDLMTIKRTENIKVGNLTKPGHTKVIAENVDCHLYQRSKPSYNGTDSSNLEVINDTLSCDIDADIIAGDELEIYSFNDDKTYTYIAGKPKKLKEANGIFAVGLEHMEVPITLRERS